MLKEAKEHLIQFTFVAYFLHFSFTRTPLGWKPVSQYTLAFLTTYFAFLTADLAVAIRERSINANFNGKQFLKTYSIAYSCLKIFFHNLNFYIMLCKGKHTFPHWKTAFRYWIYVIYISKTTNISSLSYTDHNYHLKESILYKNVFSSMSYLYVDLKVMIFCAYCYEQNVLPKMFMS